MVLICHLLIQWRILFSVPPLQQDIQLRVPDKLIENKIEVFKCEIPEASPMATVTWQIVKNDSTPILVQGRVRNQVKNGKQECFDFKSDFIFCFAVE